MPKVNVICEGQTEETFVRDVLNPFLSVTYPNAYLHAIILATKRVLSGGVWRGGMSKYSKFRDHVTRLLGDQGAVALTSFIDLYRLPPDFPGYAESQTLPYREKVEFLETALADDINEPRFIPYISTHEFEALALSDPATFCAAVGASQNECERLVQICAGFDSPERINGVQPPSKIILDTIPQYDKVRHGSISTSKIGLPAIRLRCEHFNDWLIRITSLL